MENEKILKLAEMCKNSYEDKNNIYNSYIEKNGFKAGIIIDHEYKIIYLVIRGTANWQGVINDIEIIFTKLPFFTEYLDEIYQIALYNANDLNYNIIATGHSLGGSLCQYLTNKYGVESVTFNPYGIKSSLEVISEHNEQFCINYNVYDDVVAAINANNHYGKCIAVDIKEYKHLNLINKYIRRHNINILIDIFKERIKNENK